MTAGLITTRVLRGFDDPSFGPVQWERLLATGPSDVVFLTWQWQSAWWEAFGRGELLLVIAERDGEVVGLAPFFTEAGMIYFVGSGGSDYLDFIGDTSDPDVLAALLRAARERVADFIGFVFYHVPDRSETGQRLEASAARLGLRLFDEGDQPAPVLEFQPDQKNVIEAANKKSLVRHEKSFAREGPLNVTHHSGAADILPHLDDFFAQHRERWAPTPYPSLFCDAQQTQFYRRLTSAAAAAGWLRFTRVEWQGRPIAFHFGFHHRGSFMWYKPSFAIDLARRSPGEVLLRHLLLRAAAEGAHEFDLGLGEEAFKSRFATCVRRVHNWGLYDPNAVAAKPPI